MIEAKVVADSINGAGIRITTMNLKYPRFIHSEFMTHRVFSRNASSSRAIPIWKIIEEIKDNPATPLEFRRNKRGMQAGSKFSQEEQEKLFKLWLEARDQAVKYANKLDDWGVHKQYVNRILEPFSHINVVVTATDWCNFFALRKHSMAQPEIHALADTMWNAMENSTPVLLGDGHWHTPFLSKDEYMNGRIKVGDIFVPMPLVSSVARCARVSYKKHDGTKPSVDDDIKLYKRLLGAQPIHASPAEHQAMAVSDPHVRSGNFRGWIQYRKTLKSENITKFTPEMFEGEG